MNNIIKNLTHDEEMVELLKAALKSGQISADRLLISVGTGQVSLSEFLTATKSN